MIDLKTLKQLVKLMTENDLTELDVEGDQEKVRLRRRSDTPEVQYLSAPSAPAPAPAQPAPAPEPAAAAQAAPPAASAAEQIRSPMVGTFYSSPTPDAEPYVNVGDHVQPDTVVCIVEAMKVFNEIKAEKAGTIAKVLIESGQAVEFDQPIFEITPD